MSADEGRHSSVYFTHIRSILTTALRSTILILHLTDEETKA